MLRSVNRALCAALILLLSSAGALGAFAQIEGQTSVVVIDTVSYDTDDANQTVVVYLPSEANRRAVSLFVVNYGSGDKGPLVHRFAERGFPVFFANLRRRGTYPQPVEDAFCALAWLHANAANYGADPAQIVAVGHSGGAVLAAHLGTVGSDNRYLANCPHPAPAERWLMGVAAIAGIFDYRTEHEFGAAHNAYTPRYFGGTQPEVPDVWEEASPITWVDGTEPPFLVVHGTDDVMVRPSQSDRSVSLLREAGVDVEFQLVGGADHTTVLGERAYSAIDAFIDRLTREPAEGVPGSVRPAHASSVASTREQSSLTVWYLGHCGFAVRAGSKLLVFDYLSERGTPSADPDAGGLEDGVIEPADLQGLDVYVFVTHSHSDHYDPVILEWDREANGIEYFFGWEAGENADHHYMVGTRATAELDNMEIYTINSNHSGVPEVAYLVHVDGRWIYHNGDYRGDYIPDFQYLTTLTDHLDLVFHVGLSNEEWQYTHQGYYLMEHFRPEAFFPIHNGGNEEQGADFARVMPQRGYDTFIPLPRHRGDRWEFGG